MPETTPTAPDLAKVAAIATMAALKGVTVPDSASPEGLALSSSSLDSKFGFNDGDCPEEVMEVVAEYQGTWKYLTNDVWRPVLWDMVHAYLLPALDNPAINLRFADTSHNPIRARNALPSNMPLLFVTVPWPTVIAHVVTALDKS